MTDQTYNGWKNYETWGVALVLDNDQGTYSMVRERAQEIREEAFDKMTAYQDHATTVRLMLADWLKDFTEQLCGLDGEDLGIPEPSMMARQLLAGAISDVDFEEIAADVLSES